MKKLIILLTLFVNLNVYSQSEKTIKVITIGSGKNKDIAIQNAIRNGLEQYFGAFISSKTEIMNDVLVDDQITSIVNGSVKRYNIISVIKVNDNLFESTVESEITSSFIRQLVKNKGYEVEFDGNNYSTTLKNIEMNELSEKKIIDDLIRINDQLLDNLYSFKIEASTPVFVDNNVYNIQIHTQTIPNENFENIINYIVKTYASISIKNVELKMLKTFNKPTYSYRLKSLDGIKYNFLLRSEVSVLNFEKIFNKLEEKALLNVKISDGKKDIIMENTIDRGKSYFTNSFVCLNNPGVFTFSIPFKDLSFIKTNKVSILDRYINLKYNLDDLKNIKAFTIKNGILYNSSITSSKKLCKKMENSGKIKAGYLGCVFLGVIYTLIIYSHSLGY